jgi:hypothetical protein
MKMRIVLTIVCVISFVTTALSQARIIFVFDQSYQAVQSRIEEFTAKERGLPKFIERNGKVVFNTVSETSSDMNLDFTSGKTKYKVRAVSKNKACQPCERLNTIVTENPPGPADKGDDGERVKFFVPNELSKFTKNCNDLKFPINLVNIEDIVDFTVFMKEQFEANSKVGVAIFWFPSAEPPVKFTLAAVESGLPPYDFGAKVKLELKSNSKDEYEAEWSQKVGSEEFESVKQTVVSKSAKDQLVIESLTDNTQVKVDVCGIDLFCKLEIREKCKEVNQEVDVLFDYGGDRYMDSFTRNGLTKYNIMFEGGEWRILLKKQCGVKSYNLSLKNSKGGPSIVIPLTPLEQARRSEVSDPSIAVLALNAEDANRYGVGSYDANGAEIFYEVDIVPVDLVPGIIKIGSNTKTFIGHFNRCGY